MTWPWKSSKHKGGINCLCTVTLLSCNLHSASSPIPGHQVHSYVIAEEMQGQQMGPEEHSLSKVSITTNLPTHYQKGKEKERMKHLRACLEAFWFSALCIWKNEEKSLHLFPVKKQFLQTVPVSFGEFELDLSRPCTASTLNKYSPQHTKMLKLGVNKMTCFPARLLSSPLQLSNFWSSLLT